MSVTLKAMWRRWTLLTRVVMLLTTLSVLLWPLSRLQNSLGSTAQDLWILVTGALLVCFIPWAIRQARSRFLWSLRNKLAITYLLIGLAPVVLFVTLVLVSAYVAAGQFAIHLVAQRIQTQLEQMQTENTDAAIHFARVLARPETKADLHNLDPSLLGFDRSEIAQGQVAIFVDRQPALLAAGTGIEHSNLGMPDWTPPREGFHGIVVDDGHLYLAAVTQRRSRNGHSVTIMRSMPLDRHIMELVAQGLGRASLVPSLAETTSSTLRTNLSMARRNDPKAQSVSGGSFPGGVNLLDLPVHFFSTIPLTVWDTAAKENIPVEVDSRPSLLYTQLFAVSIEGLVPELIRVLLIVLCVVFAVIEAFAFYMAMRLSSTITASVSDLYGATLAIDRGDFAHRIHVTRTDQLAELSRAFNRMTGSLQRLLLEQQEKERLQNELSIAQEVQANLFPPGDVKVPTLELHGVCRPARTVSGDYYDFLVYQDDDQPPTGVGIAIGDISGKGISAALLMATLHSAVRAYRFASGEISQLPNGSDEPCEELFDSPGHILGLLNRHLYRSTQPEKYATLFLAQYDVARSLLTYSNAGQLPPLVLRRDRSVQRLEEGGTVVGLMDNMSYKDGSVTLQAGDIFIGYSDGVTEPENDFGDFGEQRLLEVVWRYRNEPLHVISAQVLQALDAWIGDAEQPDDITLVLARRV